MTGKVLIVEDDKAVAAALRLGFTHEGWAVEIASDGADGLRLAVEKKYEIVILDVMLPKISGLDLCQQLRSAGRHVPIIMLTARGQEVDKVLGLKLGADDYVTKPFSFMELMARVEAVLRRTRKPVAVEIESYQFGEIKLNFKKLEAERAGQPLELSPREFEILKFLIQREGEVVTRDQLLDTVWGYNSASLTRTVDMHVARLRQKIEADSSHPRHLITVHRAGYKFIG